MPVRPSGRGEHEGHRRRVIDRFLVQGLGGMPPHNVLELLLFFSVPRGDTNPIAHSLMGRFGSLSAVMDAPFDALLAVKGVGVRSVALIKLSAALVGAYLEDKRAPGTVFNTAEDVGAYMRPKFAGRTRETVFLLCLDRKNKLLLCEQVAEGTLDYAPLMLRRIAEAVVRAGAACAVLAHNHPQGFAIPSREDIEATRSLRAALAPLGIAVKDHIIVAPGDFVSMHESGLLGE